MVLDGCCKTEALWQVPTGPRLSFVAGCPARAQAQAKARFCSSEAALGGVSGLTMELTGRGCRRLFLSLLEYKFHARFYPGQLSLEAKHDLDLRWPHLPSY